MSCISEYDAKKRWCPFARVVMDWSDDQLVIGPFNRDFANRVRDDNESAIEMARCIGSSYMAWRLEYRPIGRDELGPLKIPKGSTTPTGRGYCGLAGKP